MLQVGLTGGLASGKSTVARLLAGLGATMVDADRIARQVVSEGTPGLAAVSEAFGSQVIAADGTLDRPALAAIVFDDDEARARLNGIVHPLVRAATLAQVRAAARDAIVVHDVPLIVEAGLAPTYHLVVVVAAPEELRLRRAVERGLSEESARARIRSQADDAARRAVADVWLSNERGEDRLAAAVGNLWRERIVPFAANLRGGVAGSPAGIQPGQTATPIAEGDTAARSYRLRARVQHAVGDQGVVESLPPSTGEVELTLRCTTAGGGGPVDLTSAGFVRVGPSTHANADPGCPATVGVVSDAPMAGQTDERRPRS